MAPAADSTRRKGRPPRGWYRKGRGVYVEIDGKRYGHIIDPRTGRPVEHVMSVTVVAPTAMMTDALSTGLFVLGVADAARIVRKLPQVKAILALPGDGGSIRRNTATPRLFPMSP